MRKFLQFQLLIFAAIRVEEVVEKAVDISPDPMFKQEVRKVFLPFCRSRLILNFRLILNDFRNDTVFRWCSKEFSGDDVPFRLGQDSKKLR